MRRDPHVRRAAGRRGAGACVPVRRQAGPRSPPPSAPRLSRLRGREIQTAGCARRGPQLPPGSRGLVSHSFGAALSGGGASALERAALGARGWLVRVRFEERNLSVCEHPVDCWPVGEVRPERCVDSVDKLFAGCLPCAALELPRNNGDKGGPPVAFKELRVSPRRPHVDPKLLSSVITKNILTAPALLRASHSFIRNYRTRPRVTCVPQQLIVWRTSRGPLNLPLKVRMVLQMR